jgi:hypothetical protein
LHRVASDQLAIGHLRQAERSVLGLSRPWPEARRAVLEAAYCLW